MIANCGPADYNFDETVGTLRFATRAKSIKNKPKINEDPKDAMLREFQDEIAKLRAALAAEEAIAAGLPPPAGYDPAALAKMGLRPGAAPLTPLNRLAPKTVVVKKEVIKTVQVGIAPEEVDKAKAEAELVKKNLEEKQRQKEEELRQVKELLDNKKTSILRSGARGMWPWDSRASCCCACGGSSAWMDACDDNGEHDCGGRS